MKRREQHGVDSGSAPSSGRTRANNNSGARPDMINEAANFLQSSNEEPNVSLKRATLRKQTSSQQLDSCGSSDSGQGTNSLSGSLAASSSLASVVNGASNQTKMGLENNASSCSPSSSASSSSASSTTSSLSSRGSVSSGPAAQIGSANSRGAAVGCEPAPPPPTCADEPEASFWSRRRHSWLMSFSSNSAALLRNASGAFSPKAATANSSEERATSTSTSTSATTPTPMPTPSCFGERLVGAAAAAQVEVAVERDQNNNLGANDYRMGSREPAALNSRDVPAACLKQMNASPNKLRESSFECEPESSCVLSNCSPESATEPPDFKWMMRAPNKTVPRRPKQQTNKAPALIAGKIKRVQFFPISSLSSAASDHEGDEAAEGGREERVGQLLVCLDINETERRQLMSSKLLERCSSSSWRRQRRQNQRGQIVDRQQESQEYLNKLDNSDEDSSEDRDRLLASTPPSSGSSSSSSSSLGDTPTVQDRLHAASVSPDLIKISETRKKKNATNPAQFWRLVASNSDAATPTSESRASSASPILTETSKRQQRAEECSLARLIRAADEDLNNRPQLMVLNRRPAPEGLGAESLAPQQPPPPLAVGGAIVRLNSIDEEEVCLTQLESELNFSYSSSSRTEDEEEEELASDCDEGAAQEQKTQSKTNTTPNEPNANARSKNNETMKDSDNQGTRDVGEEDKIRQSGIEDDGDDDYFYDDELIPFDSKHCSQSFTGAANRLTQRQQDKKNKTPSVVATSPVCAPQQETVVCCQNQTESSPTETLLARLSDAASSRPLLVWAPSVRRVSCPVGQLTSYSSWRQLWPASPPHPVALPGASCNFVCSQCFRKVHRSLEQRAESPACSQASVRKTSQQSLLTCGSDYFSSFDQTTDLISVGNHPVNSSLLSVASADVWRDAALAAANPPPIPSSGVPNQNSRLSLNGCCRTSNSAALELRRQSTITGFDHYKYTAPRSPSLCLPAPPPLQQRHRQPPFPGAHQHSRRHQMQAQPEAANPNQLSLNQRDPYGRRLSPTHSTGGSSSPSPISWQAQLQASGGQLSAQQQHRNSMGQSSGNQRSFARARLESLESDRGSSPSWSASNSSLRSSIGGSSVYSMNLANMMSVNQPVVASNNNSCLTRKLSGCLCGAPPNSCSCAPANQQNYPATKVTARFATNSKQLREKCQQVASQQQVQQQPQQQAVYFFFCCCQRQKSDEPEDNDEQQRRRRQSQQDAERRLSLVARPAIVGAAEPLTGAASGRQQQEVRALTSQRVGAASSEPAPQSRQANKAQPQPQQQQQQLQSQTIQEQQERHSSQPETSRGRPGIDNGAPKEHAAPDLGGQLNGLLAQLEALLQRAAVDGNQLIDNNQSLLQTVKQRLAQTEIVLAGQLGHAPARFAAAAGGTQEDSAASRRSNLMRYSTPNLLLSSNFEHILRQCDRRAELEGRDLSAANEAWFLSRSPAGSRSPASAVGAGLQRLSRQISGASRESLTVPQAAPTPAQQSVRAQVKVCLTDAERLNELRCRRRSANSVGPDELVPSETGAEPGRCRQATGEPLDGGLESGAGGKRHQAETEASCQSASDSLAHANEQRAKAADNRRVEGTLEADKTPATGRRMQAASSVANNNADGRVLVAAAEANPIRTRLDSQVNSAPSNPAVASVHDKSMAQARYLYSTLTSNAGALLVASSSASAPQSPSPTRAHGVQRKQAQFVEQSQRAGRLNAALENVRTAPAKPASIPGRDLSPPRPPRDCPKVSARKQKSASGAGSSSGSSDDDDDDGEPEEAAEFAKPISGSRKNSAAEEREKPRATTPSIIESQYESSARRSSRSSGTSRSNSISIDAACASQQLQPVAMDPAMHALWAQGADLDTGNGNFIMATRRRRSVHAVHQVQLHQQQQQQQHFSKHLLGPSSLMGSSSQAPDSKCYKIEERGSSGGSGADLSSGPTMPVPGVARTLKSELRKLRATSSIDEVPLSSVADGQSSARTRFVSESGGSFASSFSGGNLKGAQSGRQSSEPPTDLEEEFESIRFAATAGGSNISCSGGLKQRSLEEEEEEPESELAGTQTAINSQDSQRQMGGQLDEQRDQKRFYYLEDAEYDLAELESSASLLANLFDWNYPIFELSNCYGDSILSKLSYRIFFDSGFFESFKIPKQAFFNFFHALEEGYHHKPYHNRLHAADVLHAVYYLTSQPIDNFCQVPLDLIEHYDNLLASTKGSNNLNSNKIKLLDSMEEQASGEFVYKLQNHIVAVVVAAAAAAADSELPFGIMGANLTALEVMALYTAAAMHDFQHPGRTNSFLVATSSPLALLYNDRSVLENHHSAAAWALFYSGPNFNWLCNLEKDEFKRFRFMIIELILATDLMRHYELVSAFNKKLNNVGRHNIDWFCESDRLLVMEIIIKLADVNGPMKGHQLHCQWTDRIAMEFYEQGDEERAMNLPVSLYMDRSDPRLPELQKSFINHLVGPLSHSYAAAGFFPKSNQIMDDDNNDNKSTNISSSHLDETGNLPQTESVYNQSKYWLIEDSDKSKLNRQFARCTQTSNLRNNFLYWDAKSKVKQTSSLEETLNKNVEDEQSESESET